ncbi:histidine kinase [Streptomyces sp. NPDC004647]|uniref:sensor histidine kinase n=1 Tax=Streptomyces sp. NPDC004647 TaxID=3154671 RepID=UPI0033B582F6
MARRTLRDWIADIGFFLFAVAFSVVTSENVVAHTDLSEEALFFDMLAGGLACALLFLRRRLPVQLSVVLLVTGAFSHFVTGATMVALFTVAAHRPPRITRWVAALAAAPLPVFLIRRPDPSLPATTSAIVYFALIAGSFGWGLYVHSRRKLIAELRERAERAEAEAQRQAREVIAREMHDVLAHRLSLLSVHAGALEFNPGAPAAEVQRASGVIRDSAHQALEDLREIIGVLRLPADDDSAEQPLPTLGDLPQLVAESQEAGMRVALDLQVIDAARAPAPSGRTVYRIVQEGLTNARKHAPDTEVTVAVSGGPGEGLAVEVRNAAPTTASIAAVPGAIPGAGQGLIGLAERAKLADGRLEYGRAGADFRLHAWLPWTAQLAQREPPNAAAPASEPSARVLPPASGRKKRAVR